MVGDIYDEKLLNMGLWIKNAFGWIYDHPRFVAILLASVFGLGLLWYLLFEIQACQVQKATDRQLTNINAHLGNIANREQTIANLTVEQAVEKEQVKEETNQHLNDVNATEDAKRQTNAMLSNLQKARDANTANSSVQDLQKALDALN